MIYHGIATFKDEEYFRGFGAHNRTGIITAYLPESKIFAVIFGEGQWITFQDWTEEQFLEKFDVVLAQND
jgi:hypothetical protein